MSKIIAIDGPAGSGKGTLAKALSKKYNLVNIDTGATYRCVALKTLKENVEINDKAKIIELAKNIHIELFEDGRVYLDNEDVTKEIRSKEVTNIVSPISSIKEVREIIVEVQRQIAKGKDVVMEGRDITTVVFPNADYKFYLDADIETRAKRRYQENQEKGIDMSYEEIYENVSSKEVPAWRQKMAEKQSAKKSKKMFKEVEKFILNERNKKDWLFQNRDQVFHLGFFFCLYAL